MNLSRILLPILATLVLAVCIVLGLRGLGAGDAVVREGSTAERAAPVARPTPERAPVRAPDHEEREGSPAQAPSPPGIEAPPAARGKWHADLGAAGIGRALPREGERQVRLEPDRLREGERFGAQVAIQGSTIAVAAPDAGHEKGSVFLFGRAGEGWLQTERLEAPGEPGIRAYGASLDLDDDWLVVGAPGDPSTDGAALVYRRQGDRWRHAQTLRPDPTADSRGFSARVSLEGESLVVACSDSKLCFPYHLDGEWLPLEALRGPSAPACIELALDRFVRIDELEERARITSYRTASEGWEMIGERVFEPPSNTPVRMALGLQALAVTVREGIAMAPLNPGGGELTPIELPVSGWEIHGLGWGPRASLFVGTPLADSAGARAGVVRWLRNREGAYSQLQPFIARDAQPGDLLGSSIDSGENELVAGAPGGGFAIVWELRAAEPPRAGR